MAWYGGGRREVQTVSGTGQWYKAGEGLVAVRWVFVKDRTGSHRDEYFYTTAVAMTIADELRPTVGIDGADSGDWVRISCTGNQGRKDNPAFVAALLRYGGRVDQRYNGATPLHYVVKAGFVQSIQVLLDHGADADAFDDRGRTPLDWLGQAAKTVDKDAVRVALKRASSLR